MSIQVEENLIPEEEELEEEPSLDEILGVEEKKEGMFENLDDVLEFLVRLI